MEKHELIIDENGILRLTLSGNLDDAMLGSLRRHMKESATLIEKRCAEKGKLRGILDLSHCTGYHPETLVIMGEFANRVNECFDRAATYGAKGTIAFARDVVLSIARWKNVRSFNSEKEALTWVHEDVLNDTSTK